MTKTDYTAVIDSAQRGDQKAIAAMLSSMRHCIEIEALRWMRSLSSADVDDLRQAGRLGVLKALAKFDPGRQLTFYTYARHWVRSSIGREASTMMAGGRGGARAAMCKYSRVYAEWDSDACTASPDRVASVCDRLGLQRDTVLGVLALRVDKPSSEALRHLPHPGASPEDDASVAELTTIVRKALAGLTPRQRYVIEQRYLTTRCPTLDEVGAAWGVSRQAAEQIEVKALAKLRTKLARYA
jgi:RNA polymerase sigma-32 factor